VPASWSLLRIKVGRSKATSLIETNALTTLTTMLGCHLYYYEHDKIMTEDGDNQSLSLNKQINKVTVSNPKTHLHQYFVIVIDGL